MKPPDSASASSIAASMIRSRCSGVRSGRFTVEGEGALLLVDVVVEGEVVWVVWVSDKLYARRYTTALEPIDAVPAEVADTPVPAPVSTLTHVSSSASMRSMWACPSARMNRLLQQDLAAA